jgi:protein SCO1
MPSAAPAPQSDEDATESRPRILCTAPRGKHGRFWDPHRVTRGRRRTFVLAAAMLAVRVASPLQAHEPKPAPIDGFELPVPMALKAFRLTDHQGRAFDATRLAGRWTLVLFGYTHCPDVCPTTLAQMAEVRKIVAATREDIPTASVFVTVDPARDTRQRLAGYVAQFGDDVIGVTGLPDDLRGLADQFRVRYTPTRPVGSAGYRFDHTASVSLLGPDGRLFAIFTLPLRPGKVAADVAQLHAKQPATSRPAPAQRAEAPPRTKGPS